MATSSCVISVKLGGDSGSKTGRCSSMSSLHNIYTGKAPYPDRPEDQDSTELNLNKQKYEKDPREALREIVDQQVAIQNVIQNHIVKPFKRVKSHVKIIPSSNPNEGNPIFEDGKEEAPEPDIQTDDKDIVKEKVAAKKKYLIVHFSHYFILGNVSKRFHFPAEFALAEFSVFNGLGRGVSGLIDIGTPPLGYSHDIRDRQKVTANPRPPFDEEFDAEVDALKRIEDLCRPHFPDGETILLFTPKEYIPIVADGFNWLFDAAGRTLNMEILPLSCLLQILANESQKPEYRPPTEEHLYRVSHESLLESILHSQQYAFSPDLACEYHSKPENEHGVEQCAETMVKRFVFNSCRFLTAFFKVEPSPNMHYPGYKTCKTTVINKRGGFRIYEMPEGRRRMSNIQHFSSCERINTLLRNRAPSTSTCISTSQDSLLSSGRDSSSSISSRNSARGRRNENPYESRPSLISSQTDTSSASSIGNTSDASQKEIQPEDVVDIHPGWESKTLLKEFRVEPDIHYGYTLSSLNEGEGTVFLPASYSQNPFSYQEAFLRNFPIRSTSTSREAHGKAEGEKSKPRGCGRGKKIPSKFIPENSEDKLTATRAPVQFDSFSQDSVSTGSGMSVTITPRKKVKPKYSKLWDTASVKSSSSNRSVATIKSNASGRSFATIESSSSKDHLDEMKAKLNLCSDAATAGSLVFGSLSDVSAASGTVANDGEKDASSSKIGFGSDCQYTPLDEGVAWLAADDDNGLTVGIDSSSFIPDSASVGGYQVDDLPVSDDEEVCPDDDSISITALRLSVA